MEQATELSPIERARIAMEQSRALRKRIIAAEWAMLHARRVLNTTRATDRSRLSYLSACIKRPDFVGFTDQA